MPGSGSDKVMDLNDHLLDRISNLEMRVKELETIVASLLRKFENQTNRVDAIATQTIGTMRVG